MTDQYVNYDYAWKQRGWEVQNPTLGSLTQTNTFGDVGLPDDVAKVLITGNFLDEISGRSLEGMLEYRTSTTLIYQTTMSEVMPSVQRIRFNDGQPLSVLLAATDDPNLVPVGGLPWQYQFRLTVQGVPRVFSSALPTTPSEVSILDLMGDI